MINVGCMNPTKVKGTRLSLYSINLEATHGYLGPTIKSTKRDVTVNNDAVFARLVQSLWKDLGEIRANYACKQADPDARRRPGAAVQRGVQSRWRRCWSAADKQDQGLRQRDLQARSARYRPRDVRALRATASTTSRPRCRRRRRARIPTTGWAS